jgi:serine/threonine-protein kinase
VPERYRLRRHIASGGMASVWCAEDRVLDRTVAIKILADRFAHDQLAVLRFKREARAAARACGHPHVVTSVTSSRRKTIPPSRDAPSW